MKARAVGRKIARFSVESLEPRLQLSAAVSTVSFGGETPMATYDTGFNPNFIATADLDGDGHLDLVTANADVPSHVASGTDRTRLFPASISVLNGRGDGTFKAKLDIPFPRTDYDAPMSVLLTDGNGDGLPDIVVFTYKNRRDLIPALASGGFGAYVFNASTPGSRPSEDQGTQYADMNGDSLPDKIAKVGQFTRDLGGITISPGRAGGGYGAATTNLALNRVAPVIATPDLNNDGRRDLIYATFSDTLEVRYQAADGSFGAARQLETSNYASAMTTGDFNSDGYTDVAVTYGFSTGVVAYPDGRVGIIMGGAGEIGSASTGLVSTALIPESAVAEDFNGDGKMDFIATDIAGVYEPRIELYLNQGDGQFLARRIATVSSLLSNPVVADFTNDGLPDLMIIQKATSSANERLTLYANQAGAAGTLTASALSLSVSSNPVFLAAGDLNGDGILDLVTSPKTFSSTTSFAGNLGQAGNTFVYNSSYSRGNLSGSTTDLQVKDLNNDGRADIVIGTTVSSTTGYLYTNFSSSTGFSNQYTSFVGGNPAFRLGNLDGDTDMELVVRSTSGVTDLSGKTLYRASVHVTGIAQFTGTIPADYVQPDLFHLADFTGDGKLDLVTTSPTGMLVIHVGRGNGTFASPMDLRGYSLDHNATALVSIDADGDGRTDLLTVGTSGFRVVTSGQFPAEAVRQTLPLATNQTSPQLHLLDDGRDGVPNLVVGNHLRVFTPRPDGSITNSTTLSFDSSATYPGHFDSDNKLDFFASGYNSSGGRYVIYSEHTDGSYEKYYEAWDKPEAIHVADLTADAEPDVIATSDYDLHLYSDSFTSYNKRVVYYFSRKIVSVATARLDDDNLLDLVVMTASDPSAKTPSAQLHLLRNNGNGSFTITTSNLLAHTNTLHTADLNADGLDDVLLGTTAPITLPAGFSFYNQTATRGTLTVMLNSGAGTFASTAYSLPSVHGITSGDIDADGKTEVVVSSSSSFGERLYLYRVGSDSALHSRSHINTGLLPSRLLIGDVNADGAADIAVLTGINREVIIHPGTDMPAPTLTVGIDAASDTGVSSTDGITKDATPTLKLTANVPGTFTLDTNRDGTADHTFTTVITGPVLFTLPAFVDGSHTIDITFTPGGASGSGLISQSLSFIIDTVTPPEPTLDLLPASDTGFYDSDNITYLYRLEIAGTAPGADFLSVRVGSTAVPVTRDASGNFTLVVDAPLTYGEAAYIYATVSDVAGNTPPESTRLHVRFDRGISVGLVRFDPYSEVTLTTVRRPNVYILTYELPHRAMFYRGAEFIGESRYPTTAYHSYEYYYAVPMPADLVEGFNDIRVVVEDRAGVRSESYGLPITLDTMIVVPNAPVLSPVSDSGLKLDNLTNVRNPVLSGSGVEPSSRVSLYLNGSNESLVTTIATAQGTYQFNSIPQISGSSAEFRVTQRDLAGNGSSFSAPVTIYFDSAAPAAIGAPVLASQFDSATAGDNITSFRRPTFAVTGAEPGATVELRSGTGGATLLASAIASASGTATISLTADLAQAAHSLTLRQTDPAGNTSPLSPALSLVVDATAPAAPATPNLTAADNTGSTGDRITSVRTPTLVGGEAEPASRALLFRSGSTLPLMSATVSATGGYSMTLTSLADGLHSFVVILEDAAGNRSAASAAAAITIDTAIPTPALPVLRKADDTGLQDDLLTSRRRPTFTAANLEPGATVQLIANGTVVASAVALFSTIEITPSADLSDGAQSFAIRQTDAAANTSPLSQAVSLRIDATPPAAPVRPMLHASTDTGTQGDNITALPLVRLTGKAEPLSTFTFFFANTPITTGTVPASGSYDILLSTPLTAAVTPISIQTTDAAGNTSPRSQTTEVTYAHLAPAITTSRHSPVPEETAVSGTFFFIVSYVPLAQTTLDWGDNSPVLSIDRPRDSRGEYNIAANHTYQNPGTYTATLTTTNIAGLTSTAKVIFVVQDARLHLTSPIAPISVDEGPQLHVFAATFANPSLLDSLSQFSASLVWSDGLSSDVSLSTPAPGQITLTASRPFVDQGVYSGTFTLTDIEGGSASAVASATVAGVAPLISAQATAVEATEISTLLIDLTDASPVDAASPFAITIDWGDGSPATSLAGSAPSASAAHTYAAAGVYTATITVADKDGSLTTVQRTVPVLPRVARGATVVSNLSLAASRSRIDSVSMLMLSENNVPPPIDASHFILRHNGSRIINIPAAALNYSLENGQARLDFSQMSLPNGFYELSVAGQSMTFTKLRGDVDGNGQVNSADHKLASRQLGSSATASTTAFESDIDGNGLVDVADLAAVKAANKAKLTLKVVTASLSSKRGVSISFGTLSAATGGSMELLIVNRTKVTRTIPSILTAGDGRFAITNLNGSALSADTITLAPGASVRLRLFIASGSSTAPVNASLSITHASASQPNATLLSKVSARLKP